MQNPLKLFQLIISHSEVTCKLEKKKQTIGMSRNKNIFSSRFMGEIKPFGIPEKSITKKCKM